MDRDKYRREYYNPPKPKVKEQPKIDNQIGYKGGIVILLVLISVIGFIIHSYRKRTKIEENALQVGQVWKEQIIQQSIYTLQPETIVVKKEIIDLDYNTVYYHQVEPETTYTFYEADPYTFKQNSYKVKN
jgi:hypothetical protein